jgi:histidinol-phosphatase
MADYSTELTFAKDAAARGARIALSHYKKDPERKQKSDGTWVTEADWAVESQIRLHIARTFPDHNVLGEEEGLTAAGGGKPKDGAPTWFVDPIDGTNNFMTGIPIWATLLGLRVDGEMVVGVVHAPALDEVYDAAAGMGARLNGEDISVSGVDDIGAATVCFADVDAFTKAGLDDFFTRLTRSAWRSRGFGDFWGHMLVARGAAHVMVEPSLKRWDVLPLQPIVAEAGGRVTHIDGSDWNEEGSCLTTNGALHDKVLGMLTEDPPNHIG